MRIVHVVGARPNFMKIAPILRALGQQRGVQQKLVHTGQHYDAAMSDVFFADLALPKPDVFLGVGSGSHAAQTAAVLVEMEKLLEQERPDLFWARCLSARALLNSRPSRPAGTRRSRSSSGGVGRVRHD